MTNRVNIFLEKIACDSVKRFKINLVGFHKKIVRRIIQEGIFGNYQINYLAEFGVISAIDDFFDQWDPSTATLIHEMCGPQEQIC